MNWFRENGATIQALSSVAGLIVTCVLVWLTGRYVQVTRDIATSSLEQVKHIKEAVRVIQEKNAFTLKSLALRIRVALGGLDSETPRHAQLRAFTLLTEQDISDLQALATQVDKRAIESASQAAGPLRVIQGVAQTAKSIKAEMGWIPTPEDATRWKRAMEAANRALQEIESTCGAVGPEL